MKVSFSGSLNGCSLLSSEFRGRAYQDFRIDWPSFASRASTGARLSEEMDGRPVGWKEGGLMAASAS
jgi:hypothetical protein